MTIRSAMRSPRSGFERPLNSIRRLCGARSIQLACSAALMLAATMPAAGKSGMGVSRLTALSSSISLDVLLVGTGNGERVGGNVLGDHRSRRCPRAVSNRHGCDEDIVAAGVDILADRRPLLDSSIVVGGDSARADVRPLADGGIADVGQVRHLHPRSE